jgi:hypothetical protein
MTGRHETGTRQVERDLYLGQRALGDYRVGVTQGPAALAKRIVKRKIHRKVLGVARRLGVW